ncbi:DNA/RNA polymerase [Daldinia caldariorum]|uniref:DNA/RNA polymerase n=1 Tax=Daldinia caldariorum TaxID=326644 RepID=UPI002008C714|nr:DNA/RNA polymerase [Daldinia caldariorum]KAI1471915.1 DNA/RNA polymerase [Daldinia caldariorum]
MKTSALTSGGATTIVARAPKRNDDRVILHFDYDCFYASVLENANPGLKGQPLGVKQKSILATCNYTARARGVRKLMPISDALKICPGLVVLSGEDLTPFRDASKRLWSFLRSHSWSDRVERLGLDEVFLDVSDVIAYNQELLNRNALRDSFFQLSRHDPEKGFGFDATRFCGCVQPAIDPKDLVLLLDNPLCVRLLLASHLAGYLRLKLEEDFGYTSSGGIAINKTLAKLAGSVNKPQNQTTLLSLRDDDVRDFMDGHKLRQIPGIGSRTAQLIQDHVLSIKTEPDPRDLEIGAKVTVREVRQCPSMSADLLERILERPGAERGGGEKIWNLLHGVDASEVKEASDVPTQISIEDTYMARPLNTPVELMRELRALATSLVRRMRVDLAEAADPDPLDPASQQGEQQQQQQQLRWIAYPKTLRLSTVLRPKPNNNSNNTTSPTPTPETLTRHSRSQPLPSFALSLRDASVEAVASRLASEALLPLFRRLHPERQGWGLVLVNVCVANMVAVARAGAAAAAGSGKGARDIGRMFRTQGDKLREWTVYDRTPVAAAAAGAAGTAASGFDTTAAATTTTTACSSSSSSAACVAGTDEHVIGIEEIKNDNDNEKVVETIEELVGEVIEATDPVDISMDANGDAEAWEEEEEEDGDESLRCHLCGHIIPLFAISAHERFHSIDD